MSDPRIPEGIPTFVDGKGRVYPMAGGVKIIVPPPKPAPKRKRPSLEDELKDLNDMDDPIDQNAALSPRKAACRAFGGIRAMLQPKSSKTTKRFKVATPVPKPQNAEDTMYTPTKIAGIARCKPNFIALVVTETGEVFNQGLAAITTSQGTDVTTSLLDSFLEDAIDANAKMDANSKDPAVLWSSPSPLKKVGAFALCPTRAELYASENGLAGNGYDLFQQRIRSGVLTAQCVREDALTTLIGAAKNFVGSVVIHPTQPCS